MFQRYLLPLFFCLVTTGSLCAKKGESVSFAIVIPSYNNEQWCIGNLESCVKQDYSDFTIYYIDDCSTDQTGPLVKAYIKTNHLEKKCIVIHNNERRGALANLDSTIRMIDPKKVVVTVDGDDKLSNPYVLKKLASIYKDGSIWMTYGNFISEPKKYPSPCRPIPESIAQNNAFRSFPWVCSQLRTFYAGLFHKIKSEDLKVEGQYFPVSGDVAFSFPLLEMASKGHFRFIPDILYIYNVSNPINDFRERRELQIRYNKLIRSRRPYLPLETLLAVS